MKDYYKISEISKLYGIGTDALRYYEKVGAIHPKRGDNGYRLYSLKDIYILNIIRDLRDLDFSMEQIRQYLECQSLGNTMSMLEEEKETLRRQMQKLKKAEESIDKRMEHIRRYETYPAGQFRLQMCPDRYCIQMNEDIRRDEEVDLVLKKLQRKAEDKVRSLGDQPFGAIISMEDIKEGVYNLFRSVCFILEEKTDHCDFLLPAGSYLCYSYKGGYAQSPERIRETIAYAEKKRLRLDGDILEIYPIDNRYTIRPEEFLTIIQVRTH